MVGRTNKFEIIPAIDILDKKVVRLTKGDYNHVQHYTEDPVKLAQKFEKHGAKRIHLVDLNGAKEGELVNKTIFQRIREGVSCQLELGGGIRTEESVKEWLTVGIDFLVLGTLLVKEFSLATQLIKAYPNKLIAGIDTNDNKVAIDGWKKTSDVNITDLLKQLEKLPIESIIHTDIQKDGMMEGPNLQSLKRISSKTTIPIIASGGVHQQGDIKKLKGLEANGVKGCIIGKAILSGHLALESLW